MTMDVTYNIELPARYHSDLIITFAGQAGIWRKTVLDRYGWDEAVRSALECFADGVALVYGNDLHQGERVAAFPILPRPTCELIGSICPAGYVHDYIDVHILDIFLQLNRRGHDRVRYLPEVVFEHMHPEAGKGAPGVSYDGRSAAADEMLFIAWAEERKYLACRLAGHIQAGARRPAPPK